MSTATEKGLFGTTGAMPRLVRVARRGPLLRPSPTSAGTYGIDLTAGCPHGCPFCHIRSSSRFPGNDRVLFDPFTSDRLGEALDELELPPNCVVLSPSSDPLPVVREIRAQTVAVVRTLLARRIPVQIMTRGRVPHALVEILAQHPGLSKVAIGLTTLDKGLARTIEPRAGSPRGRLRDLRRLVAAGVEVEVRLEPLIPERTDTRENLAPVFAAIAASGARRVVTHYLYLHPALSDGLTEAFQPLPWGERLRDDFEGGRVFSLGSLGPTKHLPLEVRRAGLARLISWGIEHGLAVSTGASQNPDLPLARTP